MQVPLRSPVLVLAAFVAVGGAAGCGDTPLVSPPTQLTGTAAGGGLGDLGPVDAGTPVKVPTLPAPTPPVRPGTGAPYPIVLLHGMGGFDTMKGLPVTYFNGVQADLVAHGETQVFVTEVAPYDTSVNRAAALAPQIDAILAKTGASKVNLIAHSQGGMDARILASPGGLGYGDRIASITTIGTPNRGTPVADLLLKLVKGIPTQVTQDVTDAVLKLLQMTLYDVQTDPDLLGQLREMSTDHMQNVFNKAYPDDPDVAYMSYAGRTNLETGLIGCGGSVYPNDPTHVDTTQAELLPTAIYLEGGVRKPNDGLVPVSSARWGTFMRCIPADHGDEIGQPNENGAGAISGFDHLVFYEQVVKRLRGLGF